jgi:hypothetical protein
MKPPKGMTPDEELNDLQKKYHLLGKPAGTGYPPLNFSSGKLARLRNPLLRLVKSGLKVYSSIMARPS